MGIREPADIRRHAAYHEAGHVIADLVFGFRFTSVTIRPGESGEYDGGVYGGTRGRARDLAVVQLAGIAASAKMTGTETGETRNLFDDDRADIATAQAFIDNWVVFLSRTYGEASYREKLWDEAEQATRILVDRNWRPIEVIAGALLEKETLSHDDVIRLVKERCPDFRFGERA
jgi:hypothetical protein